MTEQRSGDVAEATLREYGSGQKLFGRYTLIKVLGRGGMGIVWLARDEELEREVALKFLPDLMLQDRAALDDLKRETRRSLELTHPHIIRIHDFVHDERSGCISMEYVDGETLASLRCQKEQKVFQPDELTSWIAQLCDALDYAHNRARVIHRDLKPANLMVNQRGDLKVADFGIGRTLAESLKLLTLEQGRSGTLAYMSPQQLDGERGTHLDDIYSLGATLYDLLTSKPPFYSGNIDRQIHERVAPSMTERRKEFNIEPALVPQVWEDAVAACLAKDPSRRPQSAAEVVQRLQLSLAKTGTVPSVPSRRRSSKLLFGTGIAAVCVLAIAGSYFGFLKRHGKPVATAANAAVESAARRIPEKSIAVLPFENLSSDKENAFFTDGVQDEILTYLARIADLKVISRTSVMPYKSGMPRNMQEIGQQLGVANVVEGSVQRSGNRVRVNAQLVDARTDRHLWGQTYDRDLADVFAIQSEIAKTIADQLQANLSPSEKNAIERPPTTDISAFDLYARAKSERADDFKVVDLLTQAVARDPSFFDAYCELAYAHGWLYFLGVDHTSARLALAEAALQAASRLRPDAGETHLARGQNLYWGYRDYDGALAELEAARQSLPNDARIFRLTGHIQRRQGHWEESTRNLERAAEFDPRDETVPAGVANNYWFCRRYAEAKHWYARVLAFEPNDADTKVMLAWVDFAWKADSRPLHQTIDSIRATNPAAVPSIAQWWLYCALAERNGAAAKNALIALGDNAILFTHNVPLNRSFMEGVIARMIKGDAKARSAFSAARVEQEKIVQAQPNFGPALCVLGLIDAGLGRKDDALREGQRAVELLPVEKDAMDGSAMIKYLAIIAAWVGEKDLACEQLAVVIRRPSGLNYGELKLLPFWDPLRGDPRFEEIVEAAKKPVALK